MDVQRRLMVIADIGGYTRFMLATRISLAHAQIAVTGLLEAVLDGATHLELAKLEGDAAFFSAPENAHRPCTDEDDSSDLAAELADIRRRFLEKKQALVDSRMCSCAGCTQLEALTLKFVVHSGEVAVHKVRNLEELSGVDVILLHRLLKNSVPIKEYVLLTDAVLPHLPAATTDGAAELEEDLEGIGLTKTRWVASESLAHLQPPAPTTTTQQKTAPSLWRKAAMELRALPYLLGFKKPAQGWRQLDQ